MVACGILGLSFVHDGRRLKFDEISIRLLKPYLFHKSFPLFSPDPSSLSPLFSLWAFFRYGADVWRKSVVGGSCKS